MLAGAGAHLGMDGVVFTDGAILGMDMDGVIPVMDGVIPVTDGVILVTDGVIILLTTVPIPMANDMLTIRVV